MLNCLLRVKPEWADKYPKEIGLGEAAIDAIIGFIIVFVGIALLVGVIKLVGFLMQKFSGKKIAKKKETLEVEKKEQAESEEEELSEETVAVIMSALMAYYSKEKPECEFTVKRIKRI